MILIVLLVIAYAGLYVVLSVPSVQERIRTTVCSEVSSLLGGDFRIGSLSLRPFSEVVLTDVTLDTTDGDRCASIGKVAAGIDLWTLLTERRIVLNYAELIGMDATLTQLEEHSPLNIQFLIDALSPKAKDQPATSFDIRIRNVVVRDSKASFHRPWIDSVSSIGPRKDMIEISRLRMDLSIPTLSNDLFSFAIRNIQFHSSLGLEVRGLSGNVQYSKDSGKEKTDRLAVKDLKLNLPQTSLSFGPIELDLVRPLELNADVKGTLTPCDFEGLLPQTGGFKTPWNMEIQAEVKENNIDLTGLRLENEDAHSSINLSGSVSDYRSKDSICGLVDHLQIDMSPSLISDVMALLPGLKEKTRHILQSVGNVRLEMEGRVSNNETSELKGVISTGQGDGDFHITAEGLRTKRPEINAAVRLEEVEFGRILGTNMIGKASLDIDADIKGLDKHAEGRVSLTSDECELMGNILTGIDIEVNREGDAFDLSLAGECEGMKVKGDGSVMLAGRETKVEADIDFLEVNPHDFGLRGKMSDFSYTGRVTVNTMGDNIDNLTGKIDLNGLTVVGPDSRTLTMNHLTITSDTLPTSEQTGGIHPSRKIRINSDWLDADIKGSIVPSKIGYEIQRMTGEVMPVLIGSKQEIKAEEPSYNDFIFNINIKGASSPYEFLELPVRPLIDIHMKGGMDSPHGRTYLSFNTPHLQQGRNKLIRDVDFSAEIDASLGMARMIAGLIFPAKKGDAELKVGVGAAHDKLSADLQINPTMQSVVKGGIGLSASFSRLPDAFNPRGALAVRVDFLPTVISVNDKAWSVSDGSIDWSGKKITIKDFLINHDQQYIKIHGIASENAEDIVKVKLNDIDLEYIFNILNINYVTFGGMATGEVMGSRLLTKSPEARTEYLRVKGLSYNGAVLGDGDLASEYDITSQRVGIYAVIRDPLTRERRASVDGGVWVTRDSLSFSFDADKVNVGIMKPFVSAFCSDLDGEASGRCKLFGTFSDIDLVGDLKADTLSMKLDFTNTWYHAGNDSVFLHKGVIEIPPLTLYDDAGHTAEFSGWLRHTYFHNPVFNFRLRDAKKLLCYDTNERINPLWYGTIYGSGHAQINGYPGLIDIDMNMVTEEGSKFCYVITDAEDVDQSSFLSFTDRRKESHESSAADSVPEYLLKFRKRTEEAESGTSNVVLSLKGTVTNDALVTLVMDPRAGDNITARGQGALQMDYNLASNDLRMIGTYVLDEGNYNFTLQDIIIKNFNIRKGSLIKFDGDPMKAILDITATYRVNTNLTDLDKSFSTDKELNRTNVPVDAVLLVDGPMTNPDITFDIELPSLTSDVERKVKSIVSTNDMMSRQIIYLLALNRFYTPEYTGGQTSSGSEWSSMASSTISSQLSNILSQMTDKLDVAPSFRSDKGDFSDMEFDLALSSRLLNNRLLINGNFGYRDKNTSNTQFVGDFDIEYLLSKNGNLRLKAYNHFNDQNYYLRSALTTQGVGVVFRRDFDRLFRRKQEEKGETSEKTDTEGKRELLMERHGEEERDTINNQTDKQRHKKSKEI